LTTSLGGLSYQGFGVSSGSVYASAPNSTTSLSSPFSQNNPVALSRLSAISGRDASPVTMRQSSGQTVPYNPLEWTSARGTSPQLGAAAQQGRASPQVYSDGEYVDISRESKITHTPFNLFCILSQFTADDVASCECSSCVSIMSEGHDGSCEAIQLMFGLVFRSPSTSLLLRRRYSSPPNIYEWSLIDTMQSF
jgi:hypothetical protein